MNFLTKNPKDALPYKYYYFVVILICCAGLADTIYLTISHYRNYTDISYASFCALSKAINCDTVAQSPWSIMLGLPVSLWGLLSYLFFLIFVIAVHKNDPVVRPLWSLLFVLGVIYSLAALYFGFISSTKINAYCLMCFISYIISFSLLFYSWLIRRRFCDASLSNDLKKVIKIIFDSFFIKTAISLVTVGFVFLQLFLPHYWQYNLHVADTNIPTGITEEGNPWIGAENPKLVIEEYSDYLCFQCQKMHYMLRNLISKNPNTLRLVHHHYPMDHKFNPIVVPKEFHVGSGEMALLAIYATKKNKFWEMNDILYELSNLKLSFTTQLLGEKVNIPSSDLAMAIKDPTIHSILRNDILKGMKLNITGTPTFVINGETYQGSIPAARIKSMLTKGSY